ncbi:MAG: energy transducer TonB [Nitrospiraceae bacterium]|nr:MAG: energy transducer TonB [Nitrospiraceae bacterium]
MNFKKTITISVLFHISLFSAALLFSAGILKGSGDGLEQKVFFVNFEADGDLKTPGKQTAAQTASLPVQEKELKDETEPIDHETETTEVVKAEDAIETVDEPVAEETVAQEHKDSPVDKTVLTDEELYTVAKGNVDEGLDEINKDGTAVQAEYETPAAESRGVMNGSASAGLSPGIIQLIGNAIERVKTYPVLARKRGLEGTVYVSFRINESGKPDDIEIKKSSGFSILDRATVKVVKKAAPYPLIASRIEVPVAYRLEN